MPRFIPTEGELAHGSDRIELLTSRYGFCVGGACFPEKHPESADIDEDVRSVKRKADAGASSLITNLFFAELLAGGAPGVPFFTMNCSPATRAILSALRAARQWDPVGRWRSESEPGLSHPMWLMF